MAPLLFGIPTPTITTSLGTRSASFPTIKESQDTNDMTTSGPTDRKEKHSVQEPNQALAPHATVSESFGVTSHLATINTVHAQSTSSLLFARRRLSASEAERKCKVDKGSSPTDSNHHLLEKEKVSGGRSTRPTMGGNETDHSTLLSQCYTITKEIFSLHDMVFDNIFPKQRYPSIPISILSPNPNNDKEQVCIYLHFLC